MIINRATHYHEFLTPDKVEQVKSQRPDMSVDPLDSIFKFRQDSTDIDQKIQYSSAREGLESVDDAVQGLNGIRSEIKNLYQLSLKGQGTGFSRVDRQAYQASVASSRRAINDYAYRFIENLAIGEDEPTLDAQQMASGVKLPGLYEAIARIATSGVDTNILNIDDARLMTQEQSRISEELFVAADDYAELFLKKMTNAGFELLRHFGVVASRVNRQKIPDKLVQNSDVVAQAISNRIQEDQVQVEEVHRKSELEFQI